VTPAVAASHAKEYKPGFGLDAGGSARLLRSLGLELGKIRLDLMFKTPSGGRQGDGPPMRLSPLAKRLTAEPSEKKFWIESANHAMAWARGELLDVGNRRGNVVITMVHEVVPLVTTVAEDVK
jgi:hypothetical protein